MEQIAARGLGQSSVDAQKKVDEINKQEAADRKAAIEKARLEAEAKAKAEAERIAAEQAAAVEAAKQAEAARIAQENAKAAYVAPTPQYSTNSGYSGSLADWLYKLRTCESGGNYTINTGNGYYGAYQFSAATWNHWNTGYARADLAPPEVQDAMIIKNTLASAGLRTQNPGCYAKMGLSNYPPSN